MSNQQMDVIFDGTRVQQSSLQIAKDSPDVAMQFVANIVRNDALSMFCREHNVRQKTRE